MAAKYDYSHALGLPNILPQGQAEKYDLNVKKSYKGKKARAIFSDFLSLVVDDLIQNGNVFVSPNLEYFTLSIREQSPRSTANILKKIDKVYVDVNIIKSGGKFYEFVLYNKNIPERYRSVRIGHSKYKELIKKVNGGMRYVAS